MPTPKKLFLVAGARPNFMKNVGRKSTAYCAARGQSNDRRVTLR